MMLYMLLGEDQSDHIVSHAIAKTDYAIFYMSRQISVLQETHIAICCLFSCLRKSTALHFLQRLVPLNWLLGVALGLPELLWRRCLDLPQESLCKDEEVQSSIITGQLIALSGMICTGAYVVIVAKSCQHSPGSVQRREMHRVAFYPLNFVVSYGLLVATYLFNLPSVVHDMAVLLEGCNGLLNVFVYTLQVWHTPRAQASVAFDAPSLVEISFTGSAATFNSTTSTSDSSDPASSYVAGALMPGAFVQLRPGARQYGPLAANGVGVVMKYDMIRSEFMLVRLYQGHNQDWYFSGDLKVVDRGRMQSPRGGSMIVSPFARQESE
jgi:hypothetical protein